jgi:hypothetical protein
MKTAPIISVTIIAVVMLVGLSCSMKPEMGTPAPVQKAFSDLPSITASTKGLFGKGYSWHLRVEPDGEADLAIDTIPDKTQRHFKVPKEALSDFTQALLQEEFFSLKATYGEVVPDGSTDTLSVVLGKQKNTVNINFLMNWVNSDQTRLVEPARAVRLFNIVREWFADAEAVDLRSYDNMVLDAAKKASQKANQPAGK